MSVDSRAACQVPSPGALQGIVLLLPITLSVMGIIILVPVLPQIMAHFQQVPNYKYLIQGGVLTMPALCVMLFSPLAGWLADLFGRRRILIASMIVYAFLGIAPLFLDDLYAIIASRVGVGLCEAIIMTVSTTLISDYFKGPEREKWLASQTATASASALVLIYVGGLLGAAYGWRGPFAVYLFSLLLAISVWLFTWEPSPEEPVPAVGAGGLAAAPGSLPAAAPVVFPWKRMTGICAITLFASVMFYTVQTQSSLALNVLGVQDPARLGLLAAIATVGVLAGTVIFRVLARLPIAVLLFLEFLIIGVGFAGMGKAASPWQFVAAASFNQLGCGMILPTLLTWATRGLPFQIRGRGNGTWQATFAVGQFLSGMVVTFLGESTGGILRAFIVLGAANIVGAALAVAGRYISVAYAPHRPKRFLPRDPAS
jgi:MFS family permease